MKIIKIVCIILSVVYFIILCNTYISFKENKNKLNILENKLKVQQSMIDVLENKLNIYKSFIIKDSISDTIIIND